MAYNVSTTIKLVDQFSSIGLRIGKSTDALQRKFSALARKISISGEAVKNFSRGLKTAGKEASLFLSAPIALGFFAMTKAASDAEETISKFNTIFRDVRGEADLVADSFGRNFGLAGSKSRELLGNTADLLTGFGFTQKGALDLSKMVNELAVDLASFQNFEGGAEGASHALTSALLGEREAVKSLGISIQEEDVKKKIALMRSQGITFSSLRQAKAVATLKIAMEQSKNAIGDFARTSGGLANQQRVLSARFLDLREKFGVLLIPVALKLVNVLNRMIDGFLGLSPEAKKMILIIAGIVAVAGPMLLILGQIGLAVIGLSAAFAIITSPIGLVVLGIAAVIASMTYLYLKFELVRKVVGFFVDGLLFPFKVLYAVIEVLLGQLGKVADFFQGIFSNIASFAGIKIPDVNMAVNSNVNAANQNQDLIRNFNFNPASPSTQSTLNGRLDIGISAPPSVVTRRELNMTSAPPNLGVNLI